MILWRRVLDWLRGMYSLNSLMGFHPSNFLIGFRTLFSENGKNGRGEIARGRIGFNALLNKITLLWNPQGRFQLMDLENDFYLVWFHDEDDLSRVLLAGPWVIFGLYLSVRPWSLYFLTALSGFESQVVWIRLSGLPEGYYSNCLLPVIGQMVGLVFKIDAHTDGGRRGHFARMVVSVDLRKSLVSKLWINGKLQRVEYEALPSIYFKCEMVGHKADGCSRGDTASPMEASDSVLTSLGLSGLEKKVAKESFGSWMVVERRRGKGQVTGVSRNEGMGEGSVGSRFSVLMDMEGVSNDKNGRGFQGRRKVVDTILNAHEKNDALRLKTIDKGKKIQLDNSKTIKKKGISVGGPKIALKVLKPNVGHLGLQQNRGGQSNGAAQEGVSGGLLNRRILVSFEQVIISDKSQKGSHAAVKILESKNIEGHNEEHLVFLYGNSSISQGQR